LADSLRGGERIGLAGELGAGKTCLVRGIAEGLHIRPELVRSPSFTLLVPYEGGRLPLYHVDLFRLAPGKVDEEELREVLYSPGVCAIEWFDRMGERLEDFLEIQLTFVGAEERRLVAVGHGVGYHHMMRGLRESAD
jgi:tRNA threonylcarbamoyladenosine biosynthesis protein TsaE